MLDERLLAERLIRYDTSRPEQIVAASGFVRGWLESREIEVHEHDHHGLPLLVADVGPAPSAPDQLRVPQAGNSRGDSGKAPSAPDQQLPVPRIGNSRVAMSAAPALATRIPTVVFHGHLDVVPGHPEQFEPRVEGDRLFGRGAYDMKAALGAMMCALKDLEAQERVHVRLVCVPDEESEELDERSTDAFVARGLGGEFAITGEPTNMHIGIEAKGVLVLRIDVHGRAAHSSTPWRGDNAILKAIDVFRAIESLPFSRESSEMFDRPSINLGRIQGGDALNKVPDHCTMAVDVRYLPGQDPAEILAQVRSIPDIEVTRTFIHPTVTVSRSNPFVRALREAVARSIKGEAMSVGRDGASDAAAFIRVGIPAVEFGPAGAGHHGPEEWVSLTSLARYRRALGDFVRGLPMWLEQPAAGEPNLRAVGGGLA